MLLATTVFGFIYTAWREKRNRDWATEDRRTSTAEIIARATAEADATRIKTSALADLLRVEALQAAAEVREDARKTAENLRIETLQTAHTIRENTLRESASIRLEQRAQNATILAQVAGAKGAADAAYQEANHVNLKIEDLNARLLKQGEKQDGMAVETAKVIEHIDERGGDTNTRVRVIETQTAPAPHDDVQQVEVVNQPLAVVNKP